ncbi:hypothetical protein [Bacillus sp. FJAT-29814]|uniref:DUF7716 domain-containing protein n=1 Tax=Bacillus sp. FJAT-29814 TaxID=1729688 RepID=UPI00082ED140|nr:hypothetical protein [Bacillus sp. FJAT-29814]
MEKLIKLEEVLLNPNDYSWADSLFLPENKNWNINSPAAVLNLDDLEEGEVSPQFALDNKLILVFSIQEVQDIVENANQQREKCSVNDLFDAFLFYCRNDAFISL